MVVASLPFAPEIVLPTVMNFRRLNVQVANPYGFKASTNPTFSARGGPEVGWVSPFHFGINEGPALSQRMKPCSTSSLGRLPVVDQVLPKGRTPNNQRWAQKASPAHSAAPNKTVMPVAAGVPLA